MNIKKLIKLTKSLRFILILRNLFKVKPVVFLSPKNKDSFVSDFFFFDCTNGKNTKFVVTNFSSQVFFDKEIDEQINLLVFDLNGKKILNKILKVEKNKLLELDFLSLGFKNIVGSFFVFHSINNYQELNSQKAFGAERGYAAYKVKEGIWNFMHANGIACSMSKQGQIESLVSTSFFKSKYIPQLSLEDVENFSLIFNNPTFKKIYYEVKIYDKEWKMIEKKIKRLKKFQTHIFSFNHTDAVFAEVNSNIIFCRPIIRKNYKYGFDMMHG